MYLVNKWRVSRPIFGLIDEVAERTGFYPVYPKGTPKAEPTKAPKPESKAAPTPSETLPATGPVIAAK